MDQFAGVNPTLIVFKNSQCVLVECPKGIPLRTKHAFASEGFVAWFRRHCDCDIRDDDWQEFLLGDRKIVLFSRIGGENERTQCIVEGSSAKGWTLRHPWFGTLSLDQTSMGVSQARAPVWLNRESTNAYRCHVDSRTHDSEWVVTQLADAVLYQSEEPPSELELKRLEKEGRAEGLKAGYWKRHDRAVQKKGKESLSPRLVWGELGEEGTYIAESGVRYSVDFEEGYSFGLFLDQRENRYRILKDQIEPGFPVFPSTPERAPEVLNTFSYTCGFSVCAALAGAHVVSVDLSRKYLAWGERHFTLNGLRPEDHDFLYGDVFGWLKRFRRRGRKFDVIILDPPTFSRSKEWGVFKVVRDLPKLIEMVVALLNPHGRLFVSSNAASWPADAFQASAIESVQRTGKNVKRHEFVAQPWDFGLVRFTEGYLKTWWAEISD